MRRSTSRSTLAGSTSLRRLSRRSRRTSPSLSFAECSRTASRACFRSSTSVSPLSISSSSLRDVSDLVCSQSSVRQPPTAPANLTAGSEAASTFDTLLTSMASNSSTVQTMVDQAKGVCGNNSDAWAWGGKMVMDQGMEEWAMMVCPLAVLSFDARRRGS